MSEHDDWNPDDGPPPTDEEFAEARALADRIAAPRANSKGRDADLDALVDVALRVKATAHPDNERSKHIAAAAVNAALERADAHWYRTRWRWLALVAAAVVGIGGIQLAQFRPHVEEDVPLISHAAGDEFRAELPHDARSMPIGRITDARMHAYRNVLLRGGR
jgi:hypothetical protein